MDKQALRERVWDALEASDRARFPFPPHDRIPNFAGADRAAERLRETAAWQDADVLKANPDAPQLPVRRAALREGKTLYVAVPRLREERCFLRLDPAEIDDVESATTVSGIAEYGTAVHPEAVDPVDLVVSGSVAVTEAGARVGKGEGYSDLEFALLSAFDRVGEETTTATTVHEFQIVDGPVETAPHDVPMDLVVTPARTVRRSSEAGKPSGIDWKRLDEEQIAAMPVLARLRSG